MANVKVPALLYKMSKASQKAWYKKNNMKMPDEPVERSAAAAKRVKVAPRKASDVKPDSVRAINTARMAAYMAKGGRAPIGAAGSGGNSVMAGSNMSTVRGIITGIKAGFNPTVSLDPYESERAKKTGPRSLKLKKEEVEQVDEGSKRMSAAVKLQRAFEREKTSSDTSRERGKEILAQARAEYAKKQTAKTNEEVEQVDEISTPTMSSYVKKVGAENKFTKKRVDGLNLALNKIKSNSIKKKEVEQMDEVDYKKYLKVSQEKRPLKLSAVDAALSAEKEGNPNPARKLRNSRDARKFANAQLAKKAAKARPAQKFPVYEPGRKYVGDSVELDGPVIDEANSRNSATAMQQALTPKASDVKAATGTTARDKATTNKYARRISKLTGGDYSKQDVKNNLKSLKAEDAKMKYIEEKLTAADPASKYIKDFVASENPKFAEKSKKERISMALGAYYAAKGKKNEEIVLEEPKDAADVGEYDYEGDMAKSQLRSIMANSKRMYDMLEDTTNLPEWVQSKITLAEDYIVTASNYMESEMNEEVEQVTEAEGTVAVTPKEKSLAAHHGDKTKITFGDVIKARLKSAAAKKMGK